MKTIQDNFIKNMPIKHTDNKHGKEWKEHVIYYDDNENGMYFYCAYCSPRVFATCLDWGKPQEEIDLK